MIKISTRRLRKLKLWIFLSMKVVIYATPTTTMKGKTVIKGLYESATTLMSARTRMKRNKYVNLTKDSSTKF